MFNWSYKFPVKISQDKLSILNMKAFIQHVLLGIWALLFLYGKKKILYIMLWTLKYAFDGSLTVIKPWELQNWLCIRKSYFLFLWPLRKTFLFYTKIKSIIWSFPIIANISLSLKAYFNSRKNCFLIIQNSWKIREKKTENEIR